MLAAARTARPLRHDDVRPNRANDPDDVLENLFFAPLFEGFLDAERIAKLVGAGKILLDPIVAVHRHELFGSQDTDGFEKLGADLVLAPVPARRGEKRGAKALPRLSITRRPLFFIIRVRCRMQERRARRQLPQLQSEPASAPVLRNRLELRERKRGRRKVRQEQSKKNRFIRAPRHLPAQHISIQHSAFRNSQDFRNEALSPV